MRRLFVFLTEQCINPTVGKEFPVTDLHWTIKEKLGKGRPQYNFIYYWLSKVSDISWDPEHVDNAIVGVTVLTCKIGRAHV
jgi:hypothetical protein